MAVLRSINQCWFVKLAVLLSMLTLVHDDATIAVKVCM